MELKDFLTNEEIKEHFSSDYELVNYAISVATNLLKSGKEPVADSEILNTAYRILQMILNGSDELVAPAEEVEALDIEAAKEEILRKAAETQQRAAMITNHGEE